MEETLLKIKSLTVCGVSIIGQRLKILHISGLPCSAHPKEVATSKLGSGVDDMHMNTATGAAAKDSGGSKQTSVAKAEILCVDSGGETVQYKRLGNTGVLVEVELKTASKTRLLGNVTLLVDGKTGNSTLRATCKAHSRCACWISNSRNIDLLIDWLAEGRKHEKDDHQQLAIELKKSIGMKVRK